MTAKEYLMQIRKIDYQIKAKQQQIDDIRAKLYPGISYESDGSVRSRVNVKRTEQLILRIVELEDEINEDLSSLVHMKQEIMNVIDQLDDAREIAVLYKRYVECKGWNTIAKETDYSKAQVYRIHSVSIEKIEKVLENC